MEAGRKSAGGNPGDDEFPEVEEETIPGVDPSTVEGVEDLKRLQDSSVRITTDIRELLKKKLAERKKTDE